MNTKKYKSPKVSSSKRKLYLSRVLKLLILIGFVLILFPFLSSLTSSVKKNKDNIGTQWATTISINTLKSGEIKSLTWKGGVFWVYKRTDKDMGSLIQTSALLRDPISNKSDQPIDMRNQYRSVDKSLFVFVPLENKRSCQVRLSSDEDGFRFTEPCYGAKYDSSGRVFKGHGHNEQQNLSVPMHIIEDGILKISIWVKK